MPALGLSFAVRVLMDRTAPRPADRPPRNVRAVPASIAPLAPLLLVVVSAALAAPLAGRAQAQTVSPAEMGVAARAWLAVREFAPPGVLAGTLLREDGRDLGCAFGLDSGGFLLVPARRELPPVLAWAAGGAPDFRAAAGTGALLRGRLALMVAAAEGRIGGASAARDAAVEENRARWARLLGEAGPGGAGYGTAGLGEAESCGCSERSSPDPATSTWISAASR